MCYMIITGRSLIWFLLTLVSTMLAISAIVTPKWLIGPEMIKIPSNFTIYKHPSVGIYTRCKLTEKHGYHCGRFDLFGFSTEDSIYPLAWKATMFFISSGFCLLCATVILTILTCFRQSVFGKSIHNLTGSAQVLSGILIMVSLFLHPLGWGTNRVIRLCGPDAEAFYPAECAIGWAMWAATAAAILCFICAGISLTAESANMSSKVRRRVEEGDRLVCVP